MEYQTEPQSPDHDTDDIWGDDENVDGTLIQNREIERTHHKQGYLDGLSNAKELSLQDGFDEGFPSGASLGIEVGKILSILLCYDKDLFEQCKKELGINKVLDKKYFDQDLNIQTHEMIIKWQGITQDYVNSKLTT